jgi:zinc protease
MQNWKVSRQKTGQIAMEHFMYHIFKGHPYGTVISGEDIGHLSVDDIISFHRNCILYAAPEISLATWNTDRTLNLLEKYFKPVYSSLSSGTINNKFTSSPQPTEIPFHTPLDGSIQSSIKIGRQMFSRLHPMYAAGKIAMTILGGYFSSRLMANLREDKGYTYGVGAGLVPMALAGYLFISADVGKQYLSQAIGEINKEIIRLANEPIENEELQVVKHYLNGGLMRETDGVFNQLGMIASLSRNGLQPGWLDLYLKNMQQVTPENICEFMQMYCKEKDLITVTCG